MLERIIELIKSANWETLGALALVTFAAVGRFLKGFSVGIKDEKPASPPPSDDPHPSPRMRRWEDTFERIEKNTQDLKADARQLGRDSGRDHELLVEINDGVERMNDAADRIEKMLR